MPNAVVMTGYGPSEVLRWAGVLIPEPGAGQIRIKVKAVGPSPNRTGWTMSKQRPETFSYDVTVKSTPGHTLH